MTDVKIKSVNEIIVISYAFTTFFSTSELKNACQGNQLIIFTILNTKQAHNYKKER